MTNIPSGYNYPITIQAKADPRVTPFGEGYQQRSGFEPLRTTTLNYLGLSKAGVDNLLTTIDAAGAVDLFDWDFRPHYANRKWLIPSSRVEIHDKNRLEEVILTVNEYPTGLSTVMPPTAPLPLDVVPDQSPILNRIYRTRSPKIGYFFDRQKESVNPIAKSVQMQTTTDHATADEIDLLLDRCRGVYPLIWEGEAYNCSEWQIVYQPELAEVTITLQSFNLPKSILPQGGQGGGGGSGSQS